MGMSEEFVFTPKSSYAKDELVACGMGDLFGPGNAKLPIDNMLMLDRITEINSDGGKAGKGLILAELDIHKDLWFFDCHFPGDPVMPGSLGVESMHQALELFSVQQGLTDGITNPSFEHDIGVTKWKYRGQLTPKNKTLECEVHVKTIERAAGSCTVIADGFLLVDSLRVYATTDLRIRIVPGTAPAFKPVQVAAGDAVSGLRVSAIDTPAVRRALLE